MRMLRRLVVCAVVIAAACSQRQARPREASPGQRSDLITRDEIGDRYWTSAFELVSTLRPNWLADRGRDTFGTQGELQVRIDGVRAGGLDLLRTTPVIGIAYLQYYNPIDAAARWGLGYNHGAILISSLQPRP